MSAPHRWKARGELVQTHTQLLLLLLQRPCPTAGDGHHHGNRQRPAGLRCEEGLWHLEPWPWGPLTTLDDVSSVAASGSHRL